MDKDLGTPEPDIRVESIEAGILHKILRFAAVLKHGSGAGSMKSPFVTYKSDLREAMVHKGIAMQRDPSLFLVE